MGSTDASIKVKHGLGDALHNAAAQGVVDAAWGRHWRPVARLVEACVAEGSLAPGHDPPDIIMLMSFLWRVAPSDAGRAKAKRLAATVLSGLEVAPW